MGDCNFFCTHRMSSFVVNIFPHTPVQEKKNTKIPDIYEILVVVVVVVRTSQISDFSTILITKYFILYATDWHRNFHHRSVGPRTDLYSPLTDLRSTFITQRQVGPLTDLQRTFIADLWILRPTNFHKMGVVINISW